MKLVLAVIAICISVVSLIVTIFNSYRYSEHTKRLQAWTWKQKVVEEVVAVSGLLTQSELLCQRGELRIREGERVAKELETMSPGNPGVVEARKSFAEERESAKKLIEYYDGTVRPLLRAITNKDLPDQEDMTRLQYQKGKLINDIKKWEQFEAIAKDKLKI